MSTDEARRQAEIEAAAFAQVAQMRAREALERSRIRSTRAQAALQRMLTLAERMDARAARPHPARDGVGTTPAPMDGSPRRGC